MYDNKKSLFQAPDVSISLFSEPSKAESLAFGR